MCRILWVVFSFTTDKSYAFFLQKNLNEDIIDYDLLEDLVCHVDKTCAEGAILVFLPVKHLIVLTYSRAIYLLFCIFNFINICIMLYACRVFRRLTHCMIS